VNGEIVGFLTLGAGRDPDLDVSRTGEIWGIYISPDYWRRGIGKRLAEEAARIFKARGYEDAVLWVLEGNQQARQFYETMGFSLDGAFKNVDWGRPLRAVRYRKTLELVEQKNR
jgi:ribosomal protein S18 acetylase RimI-like enzyme